MTSPPRTTEEWTYLLTCYIIQCNLWIKWQYCRIWEHHKASLCVYFNTMLHQLFIVLLYMCNVHKCNNSPSQSEEKLTWSNSSRNCLSDSPTHLLRQSAPFRMKNATLVSLRLHSLARALATRVFPVPEHVVCIILQQTSRNYKHKLESTQRV